jgi:hypothetical protein
MRKRIIAKGNVRRGDYMRAVITDTLPEEIPIIFSNDGFYANQTKIQPKNSHVLEFVEALLAPERQYTKPYRYSVLKDAFSARGLSLIHPSAQRSVADFYRKYDSLICHFVGKSPASLRSPYKVGGTFFVRGVGSDRNKFRSGEIDTVSLETTVSNPASYFAYNKISRAHEFFDSNDYLHMEKKFNFFRSLDVSKCFNSIYTHTLFWAVADIETAKENTGAVGFANDFDRLMQSMNYNETNGICVGPEVSRVFAEVIFSDVDKKIIEYLVSKGLNFRSDYEFRRYVDDYYVFAQDEQTAERVTAAVSHCLAKFNLHLNNEKTVTISRPFATKRSQIIADTNQTISNFFAKLINYHTFEDATYAAPRPIWRSDALMRSLVKAVKATCTLHGTGYETVSDYVVSAASKRIIELADGFKKSMFRGDADIESHINAHVLLIEVIYFFYTVNPTVRSSLNVARAIITSSRLFREEFPDRLPYLAENIVRWTLDLASSIARGEKHKALTAVPVEVLNILIPMREIAEDEPLVDNLIDSMCVSVGDFEYFEIISFLFLTRGRYRHRALTSALFARAKEIVHRGLGPRVDSLSAHLCLDILTCPYLSRDKRASWFNTLRSRCGVAMIPKAETLAAVSAMEPHPWFVRWDKVDLLSLLRKKELSTIY